MDASRVRQRTTLSGYQRKPSPCLATAAERAESALGLKDQPRAIIIHEKNGRRHAHVVWSRIDPEQMKALNLPYFKNRLSELPQDLYLEHGWELPEGHRTTG
jgi:Relaxase/Mobilisation nuclease domain